MTTAWSLPAGSGDRWVDDYERGRPGYPAQVIDVLRLPRTATVLDLGAGTGKLTRLLVRAFDRVIAVEPAAAMARTLVARCPEAEVLDGTAEAIPLPDGAADAVFVAEAFHRFHARRAVAEIARVLRPPGMLVAMWNLPARPWDPPIADVEDLLTSRIPSDAELGYDPLDLNTHRYASGEWRRAFHGSTFDELQEVTLRNEQTLDRDGLVAFFASMGWLADLADAQRLPLLEQVRSLLEDRDYRREWETHLYWTRLKPTPRQAA
ncbi:MAG: class I SAM-dependent methyltransferase [Candidatus Limnocylindria bacterium]